MKRFLLYLLCCFFGLSQNLAQSASADSLEMKLQSLVDTTKIIGFGVSICTPDSVLFQKGFGYADLKEKRAYTNKTIQNIASVSKTTVGASLMKAQELGLLNLDDPINKHLPFPINHPFYKKLPITIRHLANHTSTIKDVDNIYEVYGYHFGGDSPLSLERFLQRYLSPAGDWYAPGNFLRKKPGTVYEYSNIGAGLAAYILEQVSKMSFDTFTKKHLFEPLQMTGTGWFLRQIDTSQHSRLYEKKEKLEAVEWYGLATYPDGGLRTSVHDLSRFLQAIMNEGSYPGGQLLDSTSVAEMLRPFPEDLKPRKMDVQNQGVFWEHEEYSVQEGQPLIGTYRWRPRCDHLYDVRSGY